MSKVGAHGGGEHVNRMEYTMYHGERRISYGLIISSFVLIGLLGAGGAILLGRSSSTTPVVVIVTATPLPSTATMVQTSAAPMVSACLVPNVIGQDQGDAERLIVGAGLQPVKSTTYNANIPVGTVISQDPPSGTEFMSCQGKVIVIISLGSGSQPTVSEQTPSILVLQPTQSQVEFEYINSLPPIGIGDPIAKVKEYYHISYNIIKCSAGDYATGCYYFQEYGVWYFFDKAYNVHTIRFNDPFKGEIDGIAIGNSAQEVRELKGEPNKIFNDGDCDAWIYFSHSNEFVRYNISHKTGKVEIILRSIS